MIKHYLRGQVIWLIYYVDGVRIRKSTKLKNTPQNIKVVKNQIIPALDIKIATGEIYKKKPKMNIAAVTYLASGSYWSTIQLVRFNKLALRAGDFQNMSRRNEKFRQFWYHYLLHHSRRGTRLLHYLGLTVAIAGLILGTVILNPIIPILGIALAYMLSWSGHLLIEHNLSHH